MANPRQSWPEIWIVGVGPEDILGRVVPAHLKMFSSEPHCRWRKHDYLINVIKDSRKPLACMVVDCDLGGKKTIWIDTLHQRGRVKYEVQKRLLNAHPAQWPRSQDELWQDPRKGQVECRTSDELPRTSRPPGASPWQGETVSVRRSGTSQLSNLLTLRH